MYLGRVLYWLLAGAMLGFGVIAILSIGLPFIVLGLVLVIFGALRLRGAGVWAALVGFGAAPAALLVWDVTAMPWACQSPTGGALPNVSYYSCVDTPFGLLTAYHVLAFSFGVIALVGLSWPLLRQLWARSHHAAA